MLVRMRKAINTVRAAKKKPIVQASGLGSMLNELEAGLLEGVAAIETLAAAQYVIGRGTDAPRDVLDEVRAIADPEKLP